MKSILYIILSVLVLSSSCHLELDKCFEGEARVVKREIPLDSTVTRLFIMKETDIYMRYGGDEQKIEIEYPENMIGDVDFAFEEGALTIANRATCKWRRENYAPKLYINLPQLKRIDAYDLTTIRCLDTLRYEQFTFYSYSTGDMHLVTDIKDLRVQGDFIADIYVEGKAENLTLWYKNQGRFYGQNLMAQNIVVNHHGENTLHINPLKKLKATVHYIGDIKLYHQPEELELVELSSGRLIRVE